MPELEHETYPAQAEVLDSSNPREFGVSDVENVQTMLRSLTDLSIDEGADYLPNKNGFYDKLTESTGSAEAEPLAGGDSFDESTHALLAKWAEIKGLPEAGTPRTLDEAQSLFDTHDELNNVSPIHFQGRAEFATSRFVHMITGRALGKPREPAAKRYYLNPRADAMGYVVNQLTEAALENDVPLYFKYCNIATEGQWDRVLDRTDRVVIYASDAQTEFVEGVLETVSSEAPEAFQGRSVAGFAEVLADGMATSDEVTKEQNERLRGSSEGVSFNRLRTDMIFDATLAVTRDLISIDDYGSLEVGDHTIRERFAAELTKTISTHKPGAVISAHDPGVARAIEIGLTKDALIASGEFGDRAARSVQDAVARTARNVVPLIRSSDLLAGYAHHIAELAPVYGIDPDNLARNIPIAV